MSRGAVAPPLPLSSHAAPSSPPSVPPQPSPLASFAAEMFVWLWFAPSTNEEGQRRKGNGTFGSSNARLQFSPSQRFISFCHDVLTTTQVSHSVVILALLFISRLKQKNAIEGATGSEFRLAVTGLMLANKVLDDNTYTARTWSQVSSLELKPLVAGEAEFLKGLDFSLHVTEREFGSFLKLLEGHVAARNERIGRAPRKIASTSRVRRQAAIVESEQSATEVASLRSAFDQDSLSQLQVPSQTYQDGGRNVRRRTQAPMSATSTPTMGFGSFSHPLAPPASAPHPQLQHFPTMAPCPTNTNPALEISPTSSNTSTRQNGMKKRPIESISGSANTQALPHHLYPLTHPPPMTRSQSSSAAFSSNPAAYAPVTSSSHASPSPLPYQCSSQVPPPPIGQTARLNQAHHFDTLVDPFSPRYDPTKPAHQRLPSLDYYSLAAGQGHGHFHQIAPLPSSLHANFMSHPSSHHPQLPPFHHILPLPSTLPNSASYPRLGGGGGSLTSSPYSNALRHVPHQHSLLSGLRFSPPSQGGPKSHFLASTSSNMLSSQSCQGQPTPSQVGEPSFRSSRRPSGVHSSPGLAADGTSTPRPATGSTLEISGLPLGAGVAFWPPNYHPSTLNSVPSSAQPLGWSSFANSGPPGVYWPAMGPS